MVFVFNSPNSLVLAAFFKIIGPHSLDRHYSQGEGMTFEYDVHLPAELNIQSKLMFL